MSEITIGVYWQKRSITLREFSDDLTRYMSTISKKPFLFSNITMIGNTPTTNIKVANDLANLDDLVYRHAWDSELKYENANPDGTPSWLSRSNLGFMLSFKCTTPVSDTNIELSISAGINSGKISNAATITMQYSDSSKENSLIYFDNLKEILLQLIAFWKPDLGKIMYIPFEDSLVSDGFTDVGWVTYIKNTNASAMRNNPDLIAAGIEMEPVSIGGTLFSIDREMVSPDNEVQVARAKLLRAKLMENHLIDS